MEKKGFFKRVGSSIKATVNKGLGIQGAGADGGVAGGNGNAKAVPGGRVRAALRLDAMRYLNATPQKKLPPLSFSAHQHQCHPAITDLRPSTTLVWFS